MNIGWGIFLATCILLIAADQYRVVIITHDNIKTIELQEIKK